MLSKERKIGYALLFRPLLLCVCLFTFYKGMYGQPKDIIFTHYGVAEGFVSNEAFDLTQTNEGLMWITSGNGLTRFDSRTFKFYRHNRKDSNSIAHSYCTAIQSDKRGHLWIAADNDLDIFDPATEVFHHLKLQNYRDESLQVKPKSFYYDAAQDKMWVATLNGLFYCNGADKKLISAGKIANDSSIVQQPIYKILPDGNDWFWLSAGNKLIRFNKFTGETKSYTIPITISGHNNAGIVFITTLYLHSSGKLWLGTNNLGLVSFDINNATFEQFPYRNLKKESNTIFSIAQTGLPSQENVLFVGATGLGFAGFNIDTKKYTSYHSPIYNSAMGINGEAYGLRNLDNKLWIGSSTGLHCYDFSLQLFNKKDLSGIMPGVKLLPTSMMNVERTTSGIDEKCWLYIPYQGAYIYDLITDAILPIPSKLKKYVANEAGLFDMYIDTKNVLWLTTNKYGLVRYDIKKDIVIFSDNKYFNRSREWAHHIFEDSKSNLWFCTFNGLFVTTAKRGSITAVSAVNELLQTYDLSKKIVSITEDDYGKIWVTADYSDKRNAAIVKYDPDKNLATVMFNERLETTDHMTAIDIRDIVANKKGNIYISFRDEEIVWFKSNTVDKINFKVLGAEQGLTNTSVDKMIADVDGNIWCTNSQGIAKYNTRENSFDNYNLASYELNNTNNPSIFLSPNTQKMYVGQSNSFLLFNYRNNSNDIVKTQLIFNEILIYNEPYQHRLKDGDKIELSYHQNMLSIGFALLSYTNATENRYCWKLEGLEENWNFSRNNVASYSHLKPGSYTLLVKAANSNGEWKTVPIKLHIHLFPPFYATWWFMLLVVILIVLGVWWLLQRRIKRVKEKFELRNSIASDLHDEIGSTLTSISILSNVSHQAIDEQPKQAKELLEQISSQSKTIQQNMSDIVWSIRADNEKMEDLVVRIREYAAQTLEPLMINTQIEAEDNSVSKILPIQFRKDVLLICKEAINNIAKHAQASSAKIEFNIHKNVLKVSIGDNGTWKSNRSGTGTKSMQERAQSLGGKLSIHKKEEGTTVLLELPLP